MSRPIKTFALLFALFLAGMAWLSPPTSPKSPSGLPHSSAVSPKQEAKAPNFIPERPAPRKDASLPELDSGRIVETLTLPDPYSKHSLEITLLQTSFKYPLLRKEQSVSSDDPNHRQPRALSVFVGDHLLIKLQPGRSESDLKARLPSLNAQIRRRLSGSSHYLIALNQPSIQAFDQLRQALDQSPDLIAYSEPDYIVHHQSTPVFPNDPDFEQQWHLHNTGQTGGTSDADIDAPEAWGVTTGSSTVVVAVIDSGMDLNHPDLTPNLWTNPDEIPNNNLDDDNNGYIDDIHGWNFVSNTASPMDDNGHGTHTAGIVGASGNNALGVSGVSPLVKLMPLKFLSTSGSGTNSDAIDAIRYATSKGVFLSSNSWGGSGFSQAMKDAIDDANTAGVGFIAAAGNSGISNDLYPDYPASFTSTNLISVAATDSSDSLVWFSNFGAQSVHLAAGGHQILSTGLGGGIEIMSGTSMAAPQVSGAAALLKAANPSLSFAQVRTMLLATTDPLPSLTNKTQTGGRLNAASALIPAIGPQITSLTPIINDPSPANADNVASPGETIDLLLPIQNIGAFATGPLQATLSLPAPNAGITLLQSTASLGTVAPGASASHPATPFRLNIAPSVQPMDLPVRLSITTSGSPSQSWTFDHIVEIRTIATVSGSITRITGGTPIPSATITLVGPKTFTASTNSNGLYSINVTNGTYQITASAPGFVPSNPVTRSLPPSASSLNFALGSSVSNVTPLSLSSTQAKNTSTTQSITIQNTGDTPLTYTIQEVPSPDATITSLAPLQLLNTPSGQTPATLSSPTPRLTLPPQAPVALMPPTTQPPPSPSRMASKTASGAAGGRVGVTALAKSFPVSPRMATNLSTSILMVPPTTSPVSIKSFPSAPNPATSASGPNPALRTKPRATWSFWTSISFWTTSAFATKSLTSSGSSPTPTAASTSTTTSAATSLSNTTKANGTTSSSATSIGRPNTSTTGSTTNSCSQTSRFANLRTPPASPTLSLTTTAPTPISASTPPASSRTNCPGSNSPPNPAPSPRLYCHYHRRL